MGIASAGFCDPAGSIIIINIIYIASGLLAEDHLRQGINSSREIAGLGECDHTCVLPCGMVSLALQKTT
jgi:hypothetical protein